ncbi:hypothetical protein K503DRAFT_801002 [Rhizopogon vinicolor AM-OR11-026]|uniref:Uncharacterized protein n=1 Tax=Rhizopogon vinicolor AM-OR11-026 TaxID=1314800 RepID=A0A1B7MYQ3_9AGAM|nr:hypothetical protein K503DRAFT_801002 [Rhizopogon vinicolor AM-OR11-026]
MQYSWFTVFLVAFGVVAPTLAVPVENGHHDIAAGLAHGLKGGVFVVVSLIFD